ncbi:uncharacterized protein JCM6883_005877 [Sporobolomyces salmoneus]|uniref:uncharacterized protein n=1 Tax=Sporobolomyces salmoneus TaxID=183962 RepID=UPI0031725866
MDHTVISITASFDRLEYVDNGVTIGTKLRQILRNLHSRWRTVWAGHAPWDAHLKTGLLINQCLLKTISLGTQKLSLEYVEEIKRDIETIIKETKVDAPQLVPSMNLNVHVAASPGGAYPARQILPSINYHRQNEYYPPVSYNTASSSLSGYHPPPPSFLPYQQMAPNQHGFNPNVASFVPGQGQLPALNPENPVFIPGNRAAPSPYVLGYPPHDPQYPQQPPYYR